MPALRRWARAFALAPLQLILAVTSAPAEVTDLPVSFGLEGAEIVARGRDGAALPADALVGATFALGDPDTGVYTLRIDRVILEPAPSGTIALYDVSVRAPRSERWDKLCEPDPYGRTTAIPAPGFWDEDGRFERGADGAFSFACTAGAQAKCVRFGYPPWAIAPNGESLAPYHAACVRMVRADYCGDGVAHTVPGVAIQMFDRVGVHARPDAGYGAFEALWGPDGAVCLARSRRPEFPRAEILHRCPRLAEVVPAACTAAAIATLPGALLGNRS